MPIFFGLFSVLNDASVHDKAGVGLLSQELADSFANSVFLGAPLSSTFIEAFNNGGQPWQTMVVASVMIVLMTASQFITQLQIVSKNMSPETKASPMFRQQRILLYLLPLVFAFSGVAFPHRRHVLLAGLQLLDHGPAVRRHPQHADAGQ